MEERKDIAWVRPFLERLPTSPAIPSPPAQAILIVTEILRKHGLSPGWRKVQSLLRSIGFRHSEIRGAWKLVVEGNWWIPVPNSNGAWRFADRCPEVLELWQTLVGEEALGEIQDVLVPFYRNLTIDVSSPGAPGWRERHPLRGTRVIAYFDPGDGDAELHLLRENRGRYRDILLLHYEGHDAKEIHPAIAAAEAASANKPVRLPIPLVSAENIPQALPTALARCMGMSPLPVELYDRHPVLRLLDASILRTDMRELEIHLGGMPRTMISQIELLTRFRQLPYGVRFVDAHPAQSRYEGATFGPLSVLRGPQQQLDMGSFLWFDGPDRSRFESITPNLIGDSFERIVCAVSADSRIGVANSYQSTSMEFRQIPTRKTEFDGAMALIRELKPDGILLSGCRRYSLASSLYFVEQVRAGRVAPSLFSHHIRLAEYSRGFDKVEEIYFPPPNDPMFL